MTREETSGGMRRWERKWRTAAVAGLLPAMAVACSDDGPTDPEPGDPDPGPDPTPEVAEVAVVPEEVTLASLGATTELEAEVTDTEGSEVEDAEVSWSSDEDGVVTVDEDGVVTAEGSGEAIVTAEVNGESGTSQVTVDPEAQEIEVEPEEIHFTALDRTDTVEATAFDEGGTAVTSDAGAFEWESSDPDVATVDEDGVVKAVGNGDATVTAALNGAEGAVEVEVEQEVTSVEVTPDEVEFEAIGETRDLTATALDAEGHTVHYRQHHFSWLSSDEAVAEVDGTGTVTAKGNGTASVQAGVDGVSSNAAAVQVQALETQQTTLSTVVSGVQSETLTCGPGEVALSGGAQSGSSIPVTREAGPAGSEDSWTIVMVNESYAFAQSTLAVICASKEALELQRVTESFQLQEDGHVREFVECPAGTVVLGGGATIPDSDTSGARLRESAPVEGIENGWIASISQTDGAEETVEVTAICGAPPSGYERVVTQDTLPDEELEDEVQELQCPEGKRVLAGGAHVVGSGSREFGLEVNLNGPLEPEGDHGGWGTRLRNFDGQDLTIQRSAVCAD